MSDLRDLIRACKAEPDDDAPRLILADWLEEHAEPDRAMFIRHQITRPDQSDGPEPNPEWFGEWKCWGDEWHAKQTFGAVYPVRFRRGFMRIGDYYTELFNVLLAILGPAYDWTWVEEIAFGSWHNGDWTPLFHSPRLQELNRLLFIADHDRPTLVEPLSTSPFVTNLRYLCLFMVVVADEGADRLSQSTHLGRLQSLELMSAHIGPAGARALARSEVWDQLRSCSLRANRLGDEGVTELVAGRRRPELKTLDVAHCAYSDDGLSALALSDRFPNLQELYIGYSELDRSRPVFSRAGLEAVMNSPNYRKAVVQLHFVGDALPPHIEQLGRDYPQRLVINHVGATTV